MLFRGRLRLVAGLAVFAAGLLVGLLAPRSSSSVARPGRVPQDASVIDVRPVTGVTAEGEAPSEARRPDDGSSRTDSTPTEPRPSRAERATRGTVSIRSGASFGAGVLMTRDGLVLTASHVIVEEPVRVRLHEGRWQHATVVARDSESDLALLRMDAGGRRPPEAASVLGVRTGDRVLSVGSPQQLRFTVSRGIVSFVGRRMRGLRFLQTDLLVHPGSSGGPVLDDQGRIVGIMSFALRGSERIGFAVPVDYAFDRFDEHLDDALLGGDRAAFGRWDRAY